MENSPLVAGAPYAAPAMPAPNRRTPSTGERRAGARSPRRPASTATTSWRDAIHAGTTAASSALTSPKAAIPARCGHGTSKGPNQVLEKRWTSGSSSHAAADPEHHAERGARRAEHDPAGQHHAPRLGRRAAGRGHQGERPRLAAGADREGRPRQQHDLDQGHHHDQHDDRDRGGVRPGGPPAPRRGSRSPAAGPASPPGRAPGRRPR